VTLKNGQNGVRIKSWAGENVGYGYVRNITFQDIIIEKTDQPIVLDQCYFGVKRDVCAKFPSRVNASDIHFVNIKGTSSGKRKNVVGSLVCSPNAECKNIELTNIDLKSPSPGKSVVVCDGVSSVTKGACVSPDEAKKLAKEAAAKKEEES